MVSKDKEEWDSAVEKEHDRMVPKDGQPVWIPIKREDLPKGAKVLTSIWAMKKKRNGDFRARLTARGHEQIGGIHYDSANIAAPVTNEITVRCIFVISLMAGWIIDLLDVNGAFLLGLFDEGEEIFIEVSMGFEEKYNHLGDVILKLLRTLYGTKQAAITYWKEQCKAMKDMKFRRNTTDPCFNFKWTDNGLVLWFTWVNDNGCAGCSTNVKRAVTEMRSRFECNYLGPMTEYLGYKIDHYRQNRTMKITQPVMIQGFEDEFKLEDRKRITPTEPGSVLPPAEERNFVGPKDQKYYRNGVGKLLHIARKSKPEIQNATRELSRSVKGASKSHITCIN